MRNSADEKWQLWLKLIWNWMKIWTRRERWECESESWGRRIKHDWQIVFDMSIGVCLYVKVKLFNVYIYLLIQLKIWSIITPVCTSGQASSTEHTWKTWESTKTIHLSELQQTETSSLQILCHAAQKTDSGLDIFRANKQDFAVFVEAERDYERENWKGLGGIPPLLLRYFWGSRQWNWTVEGLFWQASFEAAIISFFLAWRQSFRRHYKQAPLKLNIEELKSWYEHLLTPTKLEWHLESVNYFPQ